MRLHKLKNKYKKIISYEKTIHSFSPIEIDIIEVMLNINNYYKNKITLFSIYFLCKTFYLNKIQYSMDYKKFKRIITRLFPQYKNPRKNTKIIKLRKYDIDKVIEDNLRGITFSKNIYIKDNKNYRYE